MRDLMSTNCYDCDIKETLVIVGSCLKRMQPKAFNELTEMSNAIFSVCLESTHVNMLITKIIAIICRTKIIKIVFATVDESPHCVQLHYIENEIRKAMNIDNINIIHYVAVDNRLIKISNSTIKNSKSLSMLEAMDKYN
ncbi:MAG: hypothetical protein J6Y29_07225 [Clostridiales bacterium]|nr:hypothetical protein [Clostridiales bacterium]